MKYNYKTYFTLTAQGLQIGGAAVQQAPQLPPMAAGVLGQEHAPPVAPAIQEIPAALGAALQDQVPMAVGLIGRQDPMPVAPAMPQIAAAVRSIVQQQVPAQPVKPGVRHVTFKLPPPLQFSRAGKVLGQGRTRNTVPINVEDDHDPTQLGQATVDEHSIAMSTGNKSKSFFLHKPSTSGLESHTSKEEKDIKPGYLMVGEKPLDAARPLSALPLAGDYCAKSATGETILCNISTINVLKNVHMYTVYHNGGKQCPYVSL